MPRTTATSSAWREVSQWVAQVSIARAAGLARRGQMMNNVASMATLRDKITAPDVHPQVVAASLELIDAEVSSKRGFSGAAVKTGYKVVKALSPGVIKDAVTKLLPDFATALQPLYERSGGEEGGGDKFAAYLLAHQTEAADALLSVTDAKADGAKNKTIKKTYERLRGGAKAHVEAAIPNLAKTLAPFA
jgi:hypothetical protein